MRKISLGTLFALAMLISVSVFGTTGTAMTVASESEVVTPQDVGVSYDRTGIGVSSGNIGTHADCVDVDVGKAIAGIMASRTLNQSSYAIEKNTARCPAAIRNTKAAAVLPDAVHMVANNHGAGLTNPSVVNIASNSALTALVSNSMNLNMAGVTDHSGEELTSEATATNRALMT